MNLNGLGYFNAPYYTRIYENTVKGISQIYSIVGAVVTINYSKEGTILNINIKEL